MTINKSANFKTLEEGFEFVKKLKKNKQTLRINFSGVIDNTNASGNSSRIDWIDEEEIAAQ